MDTKPNKHSYVNAYSALTEYGMLQIKDPALCHFISRYDIVLWSIKIKHCLAKIKTEVEKGKETSKKKCKTWFILGTHTLTS